MGNVVRNDDVLAMINLIDQVESAQSDVDCLLGWDDDRDAEGLTDELTDIHRDWINGAAEVAEVFRQFLLDFGYNSLPAVPNVEDDPSSSNVVRLRDLLDEISADMRSLEDHDGVSTLIAEGYLKDWLRSEFQSDNPEVELDEWPYACINWEEATEEKRAEFSTVDLDGETYYYAA